MADNEWLNEAMHKAIQPLLKGLERKELPVFRALNSNEVASWKEGVVANYLERLGFWPYPQKCRTYPYDITVLVPWNLKRVLTIEVKSPGTSKKRNKNIPRPDVIAVVDNDGTISFNPPIEKWRELFP